MHVLISFWSFQYMCVTQDSILRKLHRTVRARGLVNSAITDMRGKSRHWINDKMLFRMYFPILINNWTTQFPIFDFFFHFYSNFKRNFCRQTVDNLIRRRVLRRLIWFCNVCRSPTKGTLGLYGLMIDYASTCTWLKSISFGSNFYHLAKMLTTTNSEPELALADM